MNNSQNSADNNEISIFQLFDIIIKGRNFIFIATILSIIICSIYSFLYIPRIYKSEILLTEVEPSEIDNIKLIISEISQSDIDTQYNPFIDMGTPDFSPTVMLRIFFQYVSHKAVFLDAINSLDTNIIERSKKDKLLNNGVTAKFIKKEPLPNEVTIAIHSEETDYIKEIFNKVIFFTTERTHLHLIELLSDAASRYEEALNSRKIQMQRDTEHRSLNIIDDAKRNNDLIRMKLDQRILQLEKNLEIALNLGIERVLDTQSYQIFDNLPAEYFKGSKALEEEIYFLQSLKNNEEELVKFIPTYKNLMEIDRLQDIEKNEYAIIDEKLITNKKIINNEEYKILIREVEPAFYIDNEIKVAKQGKYRIKNYVTSIITGLVISILFLLFRHAYFIFKVNK